MGKFYEELYLDKGEVIERRKKLKKKLKKDIKILKKKKLSFLEECELLAKMEVIYEELYPERIELY